MTWAKIINVSIIIQDKISKKNNYANKLLKQVIIRKTMAVELRYNNHSCTVFLICDNFWFLLIACNFS